MVELIGVIVKTYKINIAGMERNLPLCAINDDLYIGAFIIVGDPALSEHCARELLKIAPEFDYVLTAETKGIPLVHEMGRPRGDSKYIVARNFTCAILFMWRFSLLPLKQSRSFI